MPFGLWINGHDDSKAGRGKKDPMFDVNYFSRPGILIVANQPYMRQRRMKAANQLRERASMMRHSAIGRLPLHDALMRRNSDSRRLRSASLSLISFKCRSAIRHTSTHEGAFSADSRNKSRT